MANNYIQTGRRIRVASASATVTVGTICAQNGLVGIALVSAASGQPFWMGVEGVWLVDVPSSTVTGDFLTVPGANGAATAGVGLSLSRTVSNATTIVCRAITDRGTPLTGKAYVLFSAQGGTPRSSTQV